MDTNDHAAQPRLRRVLRWPDATAVLVGITIGAGIFQVPVDVANLMGSFTQIIWLWVGCATFAFVGSLLYAELGTRMPVTGGEYKYMHECYGPFAGFMFGWAQVFMIRASAIAGLPIVTVNYFEHFVELAQWKEIVLALCIVAAIGYLNYTGIKNASIYQKLSAVIKVSALIVLVGAGLIAWPSGESHLGQVAASTQPGNPLANTASALLLVLFTMIGWERVGYVAGEMSRPSRAIPRALIAGSLTVLVLYIGINVVYHQTLGLEAIRGTERVGSDLAMALFGAAGAGLFAVLVMISATGSTNGTMMAAPRLYYAMAREGLFFRWLDHVHPKYRTPSRAIILQCVWGGVILLVRGSFASIVTGMMFVVLIFYGLTAGCLFIMRSRRIGDGNELFRMPGYPVLPALYILAIVALVLIRGVLDWQQSLIDISFVAVGLPVAAFFLRNQSRTH